MNNDFIDPQIFKIVIPINIYYIHEIPIFFQKIQGFIGGNLN